MDRGMTESNFLSSLTKTYNIRETFYRFRALFFMLDCMIDHKVDDLYLTPQKSLCERSLIFSSPTTTVASTSSPLQASGISRHRGGTRCQTLLQKISRTTMPGHVLVLLSVSIPYLCRLSLALTTRLFEECITSFFMVNAVPESGIRSSYGPSYTYLYIYITLLSGLRQESTTSKS